MAKKVTKKPEELLEEVAEIQEDGELKETLKALEKEYGKGTVIGGNDRPNYSDVISTGSVGLDVALGIGGIPRGKIIELLGWESSGKSTLSLHIIAEAQKKGLKCLLVDGENSFDEKYAKKLGVNPDDMLFVQLDEHGGERAYEVAEKLIKSGGIQLCIIDSVNALQPKKVLMEGLTQSNMGLHARLMSHVCTQFNLITHRYNCVTIFISQMREKIGVIFGSPETTQGGNALKFYAHIRIDMRKSILKDGDEAYANKTKVKVIKNKMAPPFKTAEFNVVFGQGIDKIDEIINLGSGVDLIKKWGQTITILDPIVGGETKYSLNEFSKLLIDNPEFYNDLKTRIIRKLNEEPEIKKEEENE